jgi:hypothetical protein
VVKSGIFLGWTAVTGPILPHGVYMMFGVLNFGFLPVKHKFNLKAAKTTNLPQFYCGGYVIFSYI